jgi:hypothetical protein
MIAIRRSVAHRCIRRKAVLAALYAAAVATLSAVPAAAQGPRPTNETLVAFFEAVAFGPPPADGKPSGVLRKWPTARVTFQTAGQKVPMVTHQPSLQRLLDAIRSFTGLTFDPVKPDATEVSLTVWYAKAANMLDPGKKLEPDEAALRKIARKDCYAVTRADRGALTAAIVVVNTDLPADDVDACLLKHLLRAMGLRFDSGLAQASALAPDASAREMGFADKVALRTLYDQRMIPGTPRAKAVPMAKSVIDGLSKGAGK